MLQCFQKLSTTNAYISMRLQEGKGEVWDNRICVKWSPYIHKPLCLLVGPLPSSFQHDYYICSCLGISPFATIFSIAILHLEDSFWHICSRNLFPQCFQLYSIIIPNLSFIGIFHIVFQSGLLQICCIHVGNLFTICNLYYGWKELLEELQHGYFDRSRFVKMHVLY